MDNNSDHHNLDPGEYFAAQDPNKTQSILLEKARSFFRVLEANFYMDKVHNMWRFYHGSYNAGDSNSGHQVSFAGEQGELTSLPVNHFRNIASHIYTMITANRPVMDARAINTDYKSLAQTYLANGILDYYMREKRLEDCIKKAAEMAIVMGTGYVKMEWNATAGEAFDADPETGQVDYQGEVEFSNLSPMDVVVDGTKENWNNEWMLARTFQNRFNLMAKYPDLADKIAGLPSKAENTIYRLALFSNDETDDIPVYEFYHKRTEAMPDGRYLLFLGDDITLLDMPIPYRVIPIFRIVPSEYIGTPYGYTPMMDIFPIQEMINSTISTIATNQNAFGVQNIFVKRGADISINTLEGAMNLIEGNEKPEIIKMLNTEPEIFKFLEILIQSAETLSGVNSVARGNPEASLKSGTALALVQSMALQFVSGLQQNYVKLIEDVGTALIQILKDYASYPKVVAIVGKNNRPLLKEFTGEDLDAINRVIVDMGNPLSRCLKLDTPILMHDGSIKPVQDVTVGELVMGPDSKPRTVIHTAVGQEQMYDIHRKSKGNEFLYGCNESHILSLKYCSGDRRYGHVKAGDKIDITVRDYLKLSKRQRSLLMGYKTGVEFPKKELKIPPYILGAWLGDGNSRTTCLTSMDKELSDAWTQYGESLGLSIRVEDMPGNRAKNYFITSGRPNGRPDRNSFMNNLRCLDLIKNKHIPQDYLTSDRQDRLELLAGIIDTDGTLIHETFVISQKNDRTAEGIIFLARSLGFKVTTRKRKSHSYKYVDGRFISRKYCGDINSITIGGNTHEVPTKLPRKQAKKKDKARDWLNYGIDVKPMGMGTYYGFTLKEEPHFMLGDFTVTHNTIAGRVQMAEQMLQMKLLQTPEQYFQVLNTGRLDATFEGEMSELLLIKSENEKLIEGDVPLVSPFDRHKMHIMEHKAVLADPDLRSNPKLVKIALDHIQGHVDALRNTDPSILQLIGEQPLAPPQPPPGMMPPGGAPPPPGADGRMPPAGPMAPGTTPNMMSPVAGQIQPGQQITGPGVQNIGLPTPAHPPKPFQGLPTSPNQMGPPPIR